MAYNNPYFYNRDFSVDPKYNYVYDLSIYKPIYGSSVSFESRLNYTQTVNNALKILPSSENNVSIKYNLRFFLNDLEAGNLLRTIEIAGGYKYLKFYDPSNIYKDMIGLVEDYSINKQSTNLNEVYINLNNYTKASIFNWKTSSLLRLNSDELIPYHQKSSKIWNKYDFTYIDPSVTTLAKNYSNNKIDNFWFAKNNINSNSTFNLNEWSRNFIYDFKFNFNLNNKFDFYQLDYKNSFVQNIKYKTNSHSLKQFSHKFENIDDVQCRSLLFFLEKKSGYRRFLCDFPLFLNKNKVFICTKWNHTFKYSNCHDIEITLVEDPEPNMAELTTDFVNPIQGHPYNIFLNQSWYFFDEKSSDFDSYQAPINGVSVLYTSKYGNAIASNLTNRTFDFDKNGVLNNWQTNALGVISWETQNIDDIIDDNYQSIIHPYSITVLGPTLQNLKLYFDESDYTSQDGITLPIKDYSILYLNAYNNDEIATNSYGESKIFDLKFYEETFVPEQGRVNVSWQTNTDGVITWQSAL